MAVSTLSCKMGLNCNHCTLAHKMSTASTFVVMSCSWKINFSVPYVIARLIPVKKSAPRTTMSKSISQIRCIIRESISIINLSIIIFYILERWNDDVYIFSADFNHNCPIKFDLQKYITSIHNIIMKLDKFLWSKTKVDILKYLLFRRQGISIRALDHEIPWTFPAIKKQVDSLEEAEVILIDKDASKWSITMHPSAAPHVKAILLYTLETELFALFDTYSYIIDHYFLGHIFWRDLELDLVLIHNQCEKNALDALKDAITLLFKGYFIETAKVAFMSSDEYQRRYRLADKFVLQLMRAKNG